MSSLNIGFIGFGLIGGSIARALKANPAIDVSTVVYDVDRKALTQAFEEGVADVMVSGIGSEFSNCDFIFLCAPVKVNMLSAEAVKPFMRSDAILTDVGSVKTEMHECIHKLGLDSRFIGGHPMAGSERTGYANSKEKLLENAYYIITSNGAVSEDDLERYRDLVIAMGAIPMSMTPQMHDRITAAVSHVPHVISAGLVNLVRDSDSENGDMRTIAAGGFKDITRISSSSPVMWQNICLSNKENVSSLLEDYIQILTDAKELVDKEDSEGLKDYFDGARRYRATFSDASKGPIKSANVVHVEIPDEPGALAIVITMVSAHGINIKNVGIVHNREVESGSLSIEVYDERTVQEMCDLLRSHGYDATIG